MFRRLILSAGLLALPHCLWADAPAARLAPVVQRSYSGGFKEDLPAVMSAVQTLLNTTPIEISSQLGALQYNQGFLHPVTVRFVDGAPAINENPFLYIETAPEGKPFAQDLYVNVEAYARHQRSGKDPEAFRKAFGYITTELLLNDQAGGDSGKTLPLWVQEGTAVYLSGMGEDFVRRVGSEVTRLRVGELVDDLNRPFPILTRRHYARYYLAIKYITATGGTSALQSILRALLNGSSPAEAIQETLAQDWPTFVKNVREYSTLAFTPFTTEEVEPRSVPAPPVSRPHI